MSEKDNLVSDALEPKGRTVIADVRPLKTDELDVVAGAYLQYRLEPCFVKSWSTSG